MTAEEEETAPLEANDKQQAVVPPTTSAEITNIFEFLSSNERIVFKSQQIDDPELKRTEKVEIAREIFGRSRQLFLQRFGSYLEEEHLRAIWNDQDNGDEVDDMLLEFRKRLHTRKRDVKNRRYAAMQDLIRKGDYFSELEMMNRAPELYQELVGQYLSEDEKKQRDSYDVKNTGLSGILMHTLEQKQRDEMLKEADALLEKEAEEQEESGKPRSTNDNQMELGKEVANERRSSEFIVEEDEGSSECSVGKPPTLITDEYEETICQQQWGNFDNEPVACSTSRINKPSEQSKSLLLNRSTSKKLITAGERDLLRQEFVGLMHERFLAGMDSNFDYTLIDDNTQLDDLSQLNQDKEDAYFDTSDDEASMGNNMITAEDSDPTDSEDELDIYMRHLNQHHSLRI